MKFLDAELRPISLRQGTYTLLYALTVATIVGAVAQASGSHWGIGVLTLPAIFSGGLMSDAGVTLRTPKAAVVLATVFAVLAAIVRYAYLSARY